STFSVVLLCWMMSLQPTSLPLESWTQTSWPIADGLSKSIVALPGFALSEVSWYAKAFESAVRLGVWPPPPDAGVVVVGGAADVVVLLSPLPPQAARAKGARAPSATTSTSFLIGNPLSSWFVASL